MALVSYPTDDQPTHAVRLRCICCSRDHVRTVAYLELFMMSSKEDESVITIMLCRAAE